MTRKYYHGTTRANANNILSGGAKTDATWVVSDDDYLYLWDEQAIAKNGESEDTAIRNAFESAQITAAASVDPQHELVVLEFEIPRKHIEIDESCENMGDNGAVRTRMEDYAKFHTGTLVCKHNPRLDVFILACVVDRTYFNGAEISDDMLRAAKQVQNVYMEELYEFDWEKEN